MFKLECKKKQTRKMQDQSRVQLEMRTRPLDIRNFCQNLKGTDDVSCLMTSMSCTSEQATYALEIAKGKLADAVMILFDPPSEKIRERINYLGYL